MSPVFRNIPSPGLRRIVLAIAWLLLACLIAAPSARGATWYVATDGNDSDGNGSQCDPWASITHAVDNAASGDIVLVEPGTYDGRQRLRQEFDTPVTVRSSLPYAAKLRHDAGAALISFYGRNVFLNRYGSSGQSFLRLGEDGTANYETINTLVENNLMIGNSGNLMRSPLIDKADPASAATQDILGRPRSGAPDLGAIESVDGADPVFTDRFEDN